VVNINTSLPSALAAPFNPGVESLQRDNALRPTIPKTEAISSYSKFTENKEQHNLLRDQHIIVQEENNKKQQEGNKNHSTEKKRRIFYAKRGELAEVVETPKIPSVIEDFKIVIAAIQMRYKNCVTPFPSPSIQFTL